MEGDKVTIGRTTRAHVDYGGTWTGMSPLSETGGAPGIEGAGTLVEGSRGRGSPQRTVPRSRALDDSTTAAPFSRRMPYPRRMLPPSDCSVTMCPLALVHRFTVKDTAPEVFLEETVTMPPSRHPPEAVGRVRARAGHRRSRASRQDWGSLIARAGGLCRVVAPSGSSRGARSVEVRDVCEAVEYQRERSSSRQRVQDEKERDEAPRSRRKGLRRLGWGWVASEGPGPGLVFTRRSCENLRPVGSEVGAGTTSMAVAVRALHPSAKNVVVATRPRNRAEGRLP